MAVGGAEDEKGFKESFQYSIPFEAFVFPRPILQNWL